MKLITNKSVIQNFALRYLDCDANGLGFFEYCTLLQFSASILFGNLNFRQALENNAENCGLSKNVDPSFLRFLIACFVNNQAFL